MSKLKTLSLAEIKDLVSYYQLVKNNQIDNENKKEKDLIYFNIFFDKEKIHELFYSKNFLL